MRERSCDAGRLSQLLLEESEEPVLVIRSDYRVAMMNRAARDLYANPLMPRGELQCHWLLHARGEPCDSTETVCGLKRARETGKTVAIEHEHRMGDGTRRIIEFVASPLWDPEGRFVGVVETARDITQRKRHKLVYRAKEEWEAALDAVSDLVFLTDREGKVIRCNRSVTLRVGNPFNEILGRNLRELCLESRKPSSFLEEDRGEVYLEAPHGTFEFERFPVHLDASHFGFVFVFRDVTQLKRLESIASSVDMMNNLGHVLSAVRHEIGNPLNAIKTSLTVLQESFDFFDEDRKKVYLARCLDDVARMQDLIEQLRTFNMFESVVLRPLDLVAFISRCAARLESDLRMRGIAFECVLHHTGPVDTLGDERALQHAIFGLVANAADAVREREEAMITLECAVSDEEVRISIADNGIGIEEDQLDKVFLPLFTTKPKGTGLGLAIARNLITRMNGTIELESEIRRGTRVAIALPRLLLAPSGEAR